MGSALSSVNAQQSKQTNTMAPTNSINKQTIEVSRCKSIQMKRTRAARRASVSAKSGFHPLSDFDPCISGVAATVAGAKQLVKIDKRKGAKVGVVLKSFAATQQVYVDCLDEDSSLVKDSVSVGDVLYSVNGTKVHSA